MPTNILIAIDGTGSVQWKRRDGLNSHIHRFYQSFETEGRFKRYFEGPSAGDGGWIGYTGIETGPLATEALRWVSTLTVDVAQRDAKICIIGHSRGCSAAIQLANLLNNPGGIISPFAFTSWQLPIQVEFLGLYDAVDRDALSSGDTGAGLSNVRAIRHGFRANQAWGTGSRSSFSNMDIMARHERSGFNTSHGGMGGDPGFFAELQSSTGDLYCNAWTVVLSMEELWRRYGVLDYSRDESLQSLTGDARQRRIDNLRWFYRQSQAADDFIRTGARAANFRLSSSPGQIPCHHTQDEFWRRLERIMGTSDSRTVL